MDGSEIRGSSNASVLVKYGTYTGLAKFTVWMPEFPLEVSVADIRLSQIKGWKVPEEHTVTKNKRSLNATTTESSVDDETMDDGDGVDVKVEKKRSAASTTDTDPMEDSVIVDEDDEKFRSGDSRWDDVNSIDRGLGMNCKLRFQVLYITSIIIFLFIQFKYNLNINKLRLLRLIAAKSSGGARQILGG